MEFPGDFHDTLRFRTRHVDVVSKDISCLSKSWVMHNCVWRQVSPKLSKMDADEPWANARKPGVLLKHHLNGGGSETRCSTNSAWMKTLLGHLGTAQASRRLKRHQLMILLYEERNAENLYRNFVFICIKRRSSVTIELIPVMSEATLPCTCWMRIHAFQRNFPAESSRLIPLLLFFRRKQIPYCKLSTAATGRLAVLI